MKRTLRTDIKVGDEVILDKEYANHSVVKLVELGFYFSTVEADGKEWSTMTDRLSKKEEDE